MARQVNTLAVGLQLDGRPLQPPRFHGTAWKCGQVFEESDDPDRTLQAWEAPHFVQRCDPVAQRSRTRVQELDLPGGRSGWSFARVVHGVLDEAQCAELVAQINAKGFTPALINIGRGRQQLAPDLRDGFRVIVDSLELSSWLLEVLRPHLPASLPNGDVLIDLNERCRFLCYMPGQSFAPHQDGCYRRPPTHPNAGDQSRVTLQLYLHDVPEANGGATTFLFRQAPSLACQPGAGSVLLFTQDLVHEGSLLSRGLKYTLRTEAMYRGC